MIILSIYFIIYSFLAIGNVTKYYKNRPGFQDIPLILDKRGAALIIYHILVMLTGAYLFQQELTKLIK